MATTTADSQQQHLFNRPHSQALFASRFTDKLAVFADCPVGLWARPQELFGVLHGQSDPTLFPLWDLFRTPF